MCINVSTSPAQKTGQLGALYTSRTLRSTLHIPHTAAVSLSPSCYVEQKPERMHEFITQMSNGADRFTWESA